VSRKECGLYASSTRKTTTAAMEYLCRCRVCTNMSEQSSKGHTLPAVTAPTTTYTKCGTPTCKLGNTCPLVL
jgi:hypothetical protein